jgi:hypothetical protein
MAFAPSNKLSILLCMMSYAIIGSSEVTATIIFINAVITRLSINRYPKTVIKQIWRGIVDAGTLKTLPCHTHIHRNIALIVYQVSRHINRLR